MIRTITLAAIAAALIAAPASAQSVRISTVGKTTEQLQMDITKAARHVCNVAIAGSSFPREEFRSCYKATMSATIAKSGNPALAAATGFQLAQR